MIDCFVFFDELDRLEIRLNYLAPHVERFVLCEAPITFTGKPKPLYFEENKERYSKFNITHLIAEGFKDHYDDPWDRAGYQRNYLMKGIEDVDPETMILFGDVDEIPNMRHYRGGSEGVFQQKLYCYYLNVYTGINDWRGTVAIRKKNITTLSEIRDKVSPQFGKKNTWRMHRVARHGGWHFSTLGPTEQIVRKVEAFCCQRFNTPEFKSTLSEKKSRLIDPFDRQYVNMSVEMPSGPRWLLRHRRKYRYLFYRG